MTKRRPEPPFGRLASGSAVLLKSRFLSYSFSDIAEPILPRIFPGKTRERTRVLQRKSPSAPGYQCLTAEIGPRYPSQAGHRTKPPSSARIAPLPLHSEHNSPASILTILSPHSTWCSTS